MWQLKIRAHNIQDENQHIQYGNRIANGIIKSKYYPNPQFIWYHWKPFEFSPHFILVLSHCYLLFSFWQIDNPRKVLVETLKKPLVKFKCTKMGLLLVWVCLYIVHCVQCSMWSRKVVESWERFNVLSYCMLECWFAVYFLPI